MLIEKTAKVGETEQGQPINGVSFTDFASTMHPSEPNHYDAFSEGKVESDPEITGWLSKEQWEAPTLVNGST